MDMKLAGNANLLIPTGDQLKQDIFAKQILAMDTLVDHITVLSRRHCTVRKMELWHVQLCDMLCATLFAILAKINCLFILNAVHRDEQYADTFHACIAIVTINEWIAKLESDSGGKIIPRIHIQHRRVFFELSIVYRVVDCGQA